MKKTLTVATVLTWFNIIVWGGIVGIGLLISLATAQMAILAGVVLLSSIPLNCYAAFRLQKSVRHPHIPLSHQTPVGIRFVGLMAMFFGIMNIFSGFSVIGQPVKALEAMKETALKLGNAKIVEGPMGKMILIISGLVSIVLGLAVAVNVILNIRLLRWYYFVHKRDAS